MTYEFFRFEALLERDWIQAGYPFADRCLKSSFAVSKLRQESPVFLLFLDCVWQVSHYNALMRYGKKAVYKFHFLVAYIEGNLMWVICHIPRTC